MKPYEICKKCWVVEHVEDNCKRLQQEHKVEAMIESELAEYSQTEEGRQFLGAYILYTEATSIVNSATGSSTSMSNTHSEIEANGDGESRKNKRVRDEENPQSDNTHQSKTTTHTNPIFQSDETMSENATSDENRSMMDLHMEYQHNDEVLRAIDNKDFQNGGLVTQNH